MKIKLNAALTIDNKHYNQGDVVDVGDSTGKNLLTQDIHGNPMIADKTQPLCTEVTGEEIKAEDTDGN